MAGLDVRSLGALRAVWPDPVRSIQSFNSWVRDECLDIVWALANARVVIAD